jgi:hypothetical protein
VFGSGIRHKRRIGALAGHALAHHRRGDPAGTQRLVESRIVETGGGGVLARGREVDGARPGPQDRAQTHGAGLATRVHIATVEPEASQHGAGGADGLHLGVRGRIVARDHGVGGAGDHVAVLHHHRAKGTALPGLGAAHSLGDSQAKKALLVGQGWFAHVRAPKIAVPTRMMVAPSAMATSRSWLMPIERLPSTTLVRIRLRCSSRSWRRAAKCGRDSSGSAS